MRYWPVPYGVLLFCLAVDKYATHISSDQDEQAYNIWAYLTINHKNAAKFSAASNWIQSPQLGNRYKPSILLW